MFTRQMAELDRVRPPGGRVRREGARRALSVLVGVLVVVLVSPQSAHASGRSVACGSVVTSSVTLRSDLHCTGNGLTIGADRITVNLAGHSIVGTGTGIGIESKTYDNLTVRDGTIAGFATGVKLSELQNVTFTKITLRSGSGADLFSANDVTFTASTLRDADVTAINSDRFGIKRSVLDNAALFLQDGVGISVTSSVLSDATISLLESNDLTVLDSTLVRSPIFAHFADTGLIQHNMISGAAEAVTMHEASHFQIIGNVFVGNGVGVQMDNPFLDHVNGTVITHNSFLRNDAAGVVLDSSSIRLAPTVTIDANRFTGNGFHPAGRNDHLGRPVADGLHVVAPSGAMIEISTNQTRFNASYGIFADPGTVIDGGGNNSVGDPLGCLGVVCS